MKDEDTRSDEKERDFLWFIFHLNGREGGCCDGAALPLPLPLPPLASSVVLPLLLLWASICVLCCGVLCGVAES